MQNGEFPRNFQGVSAYLVGIKGTGMSALAEILKQLGAKVFGSDTEEHFYTDDVLRMNGIPFIEGFRAENLPDHVDLVIHSAAYDRRTHPELIAATGRGLPLFSYNEALGGISRLSPSNAISGVHGKTTTTAMFGAIVNELHLPGSVLAGSAVGAFGGKSTLTLGNEFFAAETCEYKRHFLQFSPDNIVITSVEPDHLDYFRDYEDILSAFVQFGRRLSNGGAVLYCCDDSGAREAVERIVAERPDVAVIPYGRRAGGALQVSTVAEMPGRTEFSLSGTSVRFEIRIPGNHNVLNAAAAIGLTAQIVAGRERLAFESALGAIAAAAARALSRFTGSRRRAEVIGEERGILIMDDYAHHPTAIALTLEGLSRFYPGRRIVCDFMSHTYSRTRALLAEFADCFAKADTVVLHKIYASARETSGAIRGSELADAVRRRHSRVEYFEEVEEALPWVLHELRPGDLFITMGAGDNWRLGRLVFDRLRAGAAEESVG